DLFIKAHLRRLIELSHQPDGSGQIAIGDQLEVGVHQIGNGYSTGTSYNSDVRSRFTWKLRTRSLALGVRTLVVGIVNVTPDSFSDGGQFLSHQQPVDHALRLLDEGADILDIGGESTRPGKKQPVIARQELERILPVITGVLRARPETVVSVDTYKAEVARGAVASG